MGHTKTKEVKILEKVITDDIIDSIYDSCCEMRLGDIWFEESFDLGDNMKLKITVYLDSFSGYENAYNCECIPIENSSHYREYLTIGCVLASYGNKEIEEDEWIGEDMTYMFDTKMEFEQ